MHMLIQYDWPGNVRELENVIERAVILSPDSTLRVSEVLVNPVNRLGSAALPQEMEAVQRTHITDVLESCRWKINGHGNAAARLGMKPSTLRSRMKKLGIERPWTLSR
jgi:formate hydrogenlyase transcriptional activator